MGKSKKSNPKAEAAPVAVVLEKPIKSSKKKGKREAKETGEKVVSTKKQKFDNDGFIVAKKVTETKTRKKKKEEKNSSSESDDEPKKPVTKKTVPPNKQPPQKTSVKGSKKDSSSDSSESSESDSDHNDVSWRRSELKKMVATEDARGGESSDEKDSGEDLQWEEHRDCGGTKYEKERLRRIQENIERMEALGLRKQACSLMASLQNHRPRRRMEKRSQVKKEDEDYVPSDEEEDQDDDELGVSSNEEAENNVAKGARNPRSRSGKKRSKRLEPGKKVPVHSIDCPEFIDEDKALIQAIALSLEDTEKFSDVPHAGSSRKSNARVASVNEINENTRKRKKRQKVTNRVQMTEDDVMIHFCQFDEVGKGSITQRDLQRMAASHDFIWSDKDFDDMIRCFDGDGDGKLSFEDFRKIASRCGMLQVSDLDA